MNFFRTVSVIFHNEYTNPYIATLKHVGWQIRKIVNAFPCDIRLDGFRVRVRDLTVANGCGALLNAMGLYDPNNMYFLDKLFSDGIFNNFFDVGANIGVYTLIASKHSPVCVIAFEPHPYTSSLLRENVALNHVNDRVQCIQAALGQENSAQYFSNDPGSPVNHILAVDGAEARRISVNVIRGDTFCDEYNIFPEVIKLDVEGYEDNVLEGFGAVLQKVQIALIECKSIKSTSRILCEKYNFQGPFKLDFRIRTFTSLNINSEDWIFLAPKAAGILEQNGYQFSQTGEDSDPK